jgi:hypothetical protein
LACAVLSADMIIGFSLAMIFGRGHGHVNLHWPSSTTYQFLSADSALLVNDGNQSFAQQRQHAGRPNCPKGKTAIIVVLGRNRGAEQQKVSTNARSRF